MTNTLRAIFEQYLIQVKFPGTQGVPGIQGETGPTGPIGMRRLGAWSAVTAYVVNDAVSLNGTSYICILGNTNQTPPNATYWQVVASKGDTGNTGANGNDGNDGDPGPVGMNWLGTWSGVTAYAVDDAVSYDGSSYICTQAHTNHAPPNATYWDVLASEGEAGAGGVEDMSCKLYMSSGQAFTGSTKQLCLFTAESYDTHNFHSLVTNTGRITFDETTAGKYRVGYRFNSDSNAVVYAHCLLNGTTEIGNLGVGNAGANTANGVSDMWPEEFVAGDFIEIYGTFGANVNCKGGRSGTIFHCQKRAD